VLLKQRFLAKQQAVGKTFIYKRILNPTNQQNCEMAKVKECTLEAVMSAI